VVALQGCGSTRPAASSSARGASAPLAPDQLPIPAGRGPRYRLPAVSAAVARRAPVAGVRCSTTHPSAYGVHLELYAHRLVLPVSAGIGVAPPQRRRGAYVLGGACSYPLRTFEPTGVIVINAVAQGPAPVLGSLFAVWGQPLSSGRLAGFRGPVAAFVGGRRWSGSPGSIPLRRHAEIVLQIGGELPPHPTYLFPPGL
jgi:hypothetical protein